MKNKRVILVTGMSGAGKTSAMGILEDMGYHAIDQYPPQLIGPLLKLINKGEDPRLDYLALATSAMDFPLFLMRFENVDADVRVLFLEASDEELLLRYKFTRRTHPMLISNRANTLEEAIQIEREMFTAMKEHAYYTIDTTFLKQSELKEKLEKVFAFSTQPVFTISFISFGYKNGVPMDADLLFDVRFLKNPHWVEELRGLSGDDQEVYDYVMVEQQTQIFLSKLKEFLDYAFEEYVREGKNHFTVGVGCTGGQHRSVAITNWLYDQYNQKYKCFKNHRDKKDRL